MMELSIFLQVQYIVQDIVLVIYGIPVISKCFTFPKIFADLFLYGKIRGGKVQSSLVKWIEIPKSWFTHYYIFGLMASVYFTAVTVGTYFLGVDIPGVELLTKLIGTPKSISNDEISAALLTAMMLFQHSRRLYECLFVSVYSKGTMNILHYIMGFMLYSTVQLSALCESPLLLKKSSTRNLHTVAFEIQHHWNKIVGVLLFLWASYEHHQAHVILANLRKDRSGNKVIHRQHVLPRGRLFEYLAAPHFVMEILIYIAMGIVVLGNFTFWIGPVLFVVVNQSLMAVVSHQWYQENIKIYPAKRKAIIPFVY